MKVGPPRFSLVSSDMAGMTRYYRERAAQALYDGWTWDQQVHPLMTDDGVLWGSRIIMHDAVGIAHQSIYVLPEHTGKGHYTRALEQCPLPIVTAIDCNIEGWLKRHGVVYSVFDRYQRSWCEYKAVEHRLQFSYASRSGVHYMRHVDEGLRVLRDIEASEEAKRAFCLHALLQSDAGLYSYRKDIRDLTPDVYVVMLAMEYRNIANAYLATRQIKSIDEIALGPLYGVRQMLIADKVQNYKDFLLYHKGTHPRSEQLDQYFKNWLARLEVYTVDFHKWCAILNV